MSSHPTDLNAAFRRLTEKYAVAASERWALGRSTETPPTGTTSLVPGWALLGDVAGVVDESSSQRPGVCGESFLPLLPWRNERRFVELRNLVEEKTVSPVVMCRFSCQTTGRPWNLGAILYREFDLAEWLTGSPIATIYAVMTGERFANVLVRVESGIVCSVEAGTTLPSTAKPAVIDRHELIAERGVASDRVVDTQVPQSSIYTFTERGTDVYTDTDAELMGMAEDDQLLVRAAYEAAARPERIDFLRKQHNRLTGLVAAAYISDRTRQRVVVKGGACSCNR